jgi:hypothetical protein
VCLLKSLEFQTHGRVGEVRVQRLGTTKFTEVLFGPHSLGVEACCDLGCGKFDTGVSGGDSVDFVHDY